jgi:hypothetical protein
MVGHAGTGEEPGRGGLERTLGSGRPDAGDEQGEPAQQLNRHAI